MPYRKTPIVPDQIYHVFNKSIAGQTIFTIQKDYQRFVDVINYYRFDNLPIRYSHYKRLPQSQKDAFNEEYLTNNKSIIHIISYCIMPNHFHFLLLSDKDHAISNFARNIQNSYSKYYNTKYERSGSLFQSMFKAVRIENDEQLVHVSRYIHLNPVTAYLIEADELEKYNWSSVKAFLSDENDNSFIEPDLVLSHFKSREKYKEFLLDQVNYQRELDKIKHLVFE